MKTHYRVSIILLIFPLFVIYICSCSPYASGPVAMVYHNTTSHYNAYFLARERMRELETSLYKGQKDNFNKIIDIYPKIDSNYANANKDKLDKIIKNASLPIQWHKPSHWLDDAYLIIGKCRYYDVDWENAIATFRYIDTKYEDKEIKHNALIWLMRVYMEQKEWYQARRWGDYLEEEYLSPANAGRLSLANGFYYIKQGDYLNAYVKLIIGAKYIKPKEYRAKIYYTIGQLAQKLKKEKEAYKYYKLCAENKYNYDLWFYSKLNMYQMKELGNEKDAEKILSYYKKMLKDFKNTEYKDKIYYEMGIFEQKRGRLDESLDYYKKSAKSSKTNPFVKSFAYLRAAEIYYDSLQQFENSKLYYDSTLAILEKDLPEYPKAFRRQRILVEFVEQLKIVRTEDSLQRLAKMDSASLSTLIDKWIDNENKKLEEEDKLNRKLARQAEGDQPATNSDGLLATQNVPTAANITGGESNKWYFYNPVMMEIGKQDFAKKWGGRPNEDNWRRINKEKDDNALQNQQTAGQQPDTTSQQQLSKVPITADARKAQYYQQIPLTKVQMDSSMFHLKTALFKLARIYDYNLEEHKNAAKTYERFVMEFPNDEKRPEAMYAVYLVCKNKIKDDSCTSKYANWLVNEYPASLYAKLIKNPDYLKENQLLEEKIKTVYRNAFEMYKNEYFLQAENAVAVTMKEYPNNELEDRFMLLRAMIIGKTQSIKNYQDTLQAFINKYGKTSKLIPYAKELLIKADNLVKIDSAAARQKRIVYDLDLNLSHFFCIVVQGKPTLDSLSRKFKTYNNDYYNDAGMTMHSETINDSTYIFTIKQMPNKIQAMNYFERQNGKSSPLRDFPGISFEYFVITDKNYALMVSEKNYKSYREFFRKNYR